MALVDLIANSGAKNFETMRKGWLPTAEETNARKMSELGNQRRQQQIDYEPERQSYLKQKRKADLTSQKQATELFDEKMKKYKTEEEFVKKDRKLKVMSNIVRGAYARLKETDDDITVAQDVFRQNYKALKDAGDDDQDKQLDKFLDPNTPPEEAQKMLEGLNSVLPLAQEALDRAARSKGGSLFERMLIARESNDPRFSEPAKNYINNASGKTGSEQYNKTLTFKQKKEQKKGMKELTSGYKKDYKPFIHTANQITKIKNALKSGDNAAMDIQVTNMLTNIEGSGVKAKSMYDIHNAPLGNIMERIKDEVSRFVGGVKTDFQKDEIRSAIADLEKYNNLVLRDGKDKYRSMARKNKYDVGLTIPYDTFEEVKRDYKRDYLSKEQAMQYLEENKRLLEK